MTTWERIAYSEHCGKCGLHMKRGTAAQAIVIHGVTRKHWRCADCAGEDAPPDLPALLERTFAVDKPFTPLRDEAAKPEWLPYRD